MRATHPRQVLRQVAAFVAVTGVTLALGGPAGAMTRPAAVGASTGSDPGQDSVRDPRLHAALQDVIRSGATGVVAVVDDGDDQVAEALGAARLAPPRAARVSDTARVGSITKTFVSTAVLQQVAAGRIGLDEPIERRLPGVVPNGRAITVRMLLQHTSGLFNYTDDENAVLAVLADPTRHVDPQWMLDVAFSHPANFPPGSDWSYSNTNYIVLGLLLEKVTGQPAHAVLERQIIRPLNLRNTYLATDGGWRGPHLHGYAPPGTFGNADYLDLSDWNPSWAWTAGALVSNPADLTRFYQALMSGRLLPAAQLRAMTTTVATSSAGLRYGLGLYRFQSVCGPTWGHDGGIAGYLTQVLTDRRGTRSMVLVLPTEVDAAIAPTLGPALDAAVCRMLNRSPSGTAAATGSRAGTAAPARTSAPWAQSRGLLTIGSRP